MTERFNELLDDDPRRRLTALALTALLPWLGGVTSCRPSSSPGGAPGTASPAESDAIVQEKERGPVEVTLRVEPKEPDFTERIRLTIEARAEQGAEVTLPPAEQFGGAFIVKDFLSYPAEATADGERVSRQVYVLEVLTSGEYTIPALETTFVVADTADATSSAGDGESAAAPGDPDAAASEAAGDPGPRVFKIVSEPITFEVKSLQNPEDLTELRPIAAPVEPELLPPRWRRIALIGGGILAALALVAAAIVYLSRRKSRPRVAPPRPAAEIAYEELEWLLAQQFAERGEIKEFFFHLSRIVRQYIENRFGLRAPERTTEEFLEDLAGSDALRTEHKRLLREFLERADMVKFARYSPATEEIEASFEAAKSFIAQTRPGAQEVSHADR